MAHFYITTPIYYINARPHIGHAYTTMVADAVARARRLMGDEVFFLTGTDEHGQKVERAAQKAGLAPAAFADDVSQAFRQMCLDLNITNDDFIRTTEPRHHRAAQALWTRVQQAGDIYKGEYEGWYCTVDEIFVPETQLVDGRCPTCGGAVERLKEESYYFRLSRYQQPLLDWYAAHAEFLQPDFRLNEVRTFVESGLQDLSISRASFTWGIPVPGDPRHVMYVWFDALTNYLTALGFGSGDPAAEDRIARYWPTVTHLIGKEILRQHALYWPAFLMSAGLLPPRRIIAHGFWMMGGAKMSKSIGNVARYQDYVDVFGVDALRYFVMREMPLGQDANFSDEAVLTRFNADLANDLGNVVSRTTTMIGRYCEGRVPASSTPPDPLDEDLVRAAAETINAVKQGFATYQITVALQRTWELIGRLNKFIVTREPWVLAKDPARRAVLDATLYHAADTLRVIAGLIDPVMPDTAARVRRMLGVPAESWTDLRAGTLQPGSVLGAIEPLFPRIEKTVDELRAAIGAPPPSDPRADEGGPKGPPLRQISHASTRVGADLPPSPRSYGGPPQPGGGGQVRPSKETSVQETPGAGAATPAAPAAEAAPSTAPDTRIAFDEFMKVDLRAAKVLSAQAVPKSKKLLELRVDVGEVTPRTIVAGLAEAYAPDDLIGRSIVIVANLKPAKLMGIESNGMVLAASVEGGTASLLRLDEHVMPGAKVR